MIFSAFTANIDTPLLSKTYYSIGGGFILEDSNILNNDKEKVTYTYKSSDELLDIGNSENISVSLIF